MNIQQLLEEKEKEEQISRLKIWILEIYDLISFIIFALGFVLFIKYFIFTPFNVVGHSMEPTVHNGDFLIVNEITPRLKKQLHR
jgi:signal peptidase I